MKMAWWGVAALLATGCALPGEAPFPSPAGPAAAELPPAGHGALRQDQVTVELREGAVHLRLLPLDEHVIRLLAPDAYRRLHTLASRDAGPVDGGEARFLVTFLSAGEGGERFRPEDLTLEQRGRRYEPLRITPLTSGWGEQTLRPGQAEAAIYEFSPSLDVRLPLDARYGGALSRRWEEILPLLDAEAARVRARATP